MLGMCAFFARFLLPYLRVCQAWEETAFTTLNHRDQPGVFILGGLEEILMVLEDNQVTLQTMMGSRFIMGVKDEVNGESNNDDVIIMIAGPTPPI